MCIIIRYITKSVDFRFESPTLDAPPLPLPLPRTVVADERLL